MSTQDNIDIESDLPDKFAVINWYRKLSEALTLNHQRLIINFQGTRDWCLSMLPPETVFNQQYVLSNELDLERGIALSKAETLLGLETDCVVYDGFSGLNIDVFCMAAGLIKSGGILVLLTPVNPRQINDEYGQWQGIKNTEQYFFHYLQHELKQGMLSIHQPVSNELPEIKPLPFSAPAQFVENLTRQQFTIYQQLNSWIDNKDIPVFIITADRGRGKSTLLGHFAQHHKAALSMVVTAASKAQVKILLNQLNHQHDIQFMAPDEIIRKNTMLDLLIIDEAAMLPTSMLQQCMALSAKTLLATTTGGYEGSGQGFQIKFMAELNSSKSIQCQLQEAVRWGQADEMESWMNRILLLKPNVNPQQKIQGEVSIQQVSKQQINQYKKLRQQIYALLVSAHYRTRPSDLRQLMEDENQLVLVAKSASDIVGVLLLNREGGFDEALCHEIFMGRRRPQGHLFSQMITAQAGVKGFACLKGLRVQRLAVSENYRLQGVGRHLIESAEQLVDELGLNYLSSSFALDSSVATFWAKMGFSLVHISAGKGKSTGRQTVAVVKTKDAEVSEIISSLSLKIYNYLPVWLLSYCRTMLWADVYALLELLNSKGALSAQDQDEIFAFSDGFRGFDLAQASLQKLMVNRLTHANLATPLVKLCIEKVLLNKEWEQLSMKGGENQGRKHNLKQLRYCVAKINELHKSSNIK